MCQTNINYHASTGRDKNLFLELRNKKARYLGHLNFLLTCKKQHLSPKFIKISCSVPPSYRIRSTLRRMHRMVLRTVIKDTRSKLAKIESQLYRLHLRLSNDIPRTEWINLDVTSTAFTESVLHKQRATHNQKLHNLQKQVPKVSVNCQDPILRNQKVVNLSSQTISDTQKTSLELGLNFSIVKPCDNITTLSHVECSFKNSKLSSEQKDFLRFKIRNVLSSNQRTHSNLNNEEKSSLLALKNNSSLVISPSDKGGVITILDKSQYDSGIQNILSDTSLYSITKSNPIQGILKNLKSLIKSSPILSDTQRKALVPSYSRLGYMYILPKIHKPLLSFRPIVSSINTPIYPLSKFLAKKLAPLSALNTYSLNNSFQFVEVIKTLPPTVCTMVSFDIVSLFSNVPITGSILTLKRRLLETDTPLSEIDAIIKLVEFCTRNTFFTVNQVVYCQKNGLPMGGNLSPILCDIYMHYFELEVINAPDSPLTCWRRYVDDIFALWINDNNFTITSYLSHLNSLDPYIKFTVEIENNSTLPFLDVLITKSDSGFHTTVYRKPFSVQVPPHFRSAHIYSQKVTAFYSYVRRAIHHCSDQHSLNIELDFIRAVAVDRGFNPSIIDKAIAKFTKFKPITCLTKEANPLSSFIVLNNDLHSVRIATVLRKHFKIISKPSVKICHMFGPPKDVTPDSEKWGVYYIPCSCNLGYVGQTRRALSVRIKEHKRCVLNADINKSNIAKHSYEHDHNFNFSLASVIKPTSHYNKLDFIEAFIITKFSDSLVNDHHFPFISHIWRDVIRRTRFSLRCEEAPAGD